MGSRNFCVWYPLKSAKLRDNFCSSLKRNITSSTNEKKKMIVVKRRFKANFTEPVALESKDAGTVMKKLNWELKYMFGPLLQPKSNPSGTHRTNSLKKSVNYRTDNLIVQPDASIQPLPSSLSLMSSFPLMNSGASKSAFIGEANSLREELLERCGSKLPSVSRILEKTMPEESAERLRQWKLRMIEELGEEGFKKHQEKLFADGHSLHASINSYLTSEKDVHVEESNEGHWRSLNAVFPQIKNVRLLEERISHPFLCYSGILDCFAEYRNHLVVIDWKTSKKSKSTLKYTYDNPLQIAAYVGALNFDSRLQYLVNKGLIVVAYDSGAPATPLYIDENQMQKYWNEWLRRVKMYWDLLEAEKSKS